jgi:hypothetical protein
MFTDSSANIGPDLEPTSMKGFCTFALVVDCFTRLGITEADVIAFARLVTVGRDFEGDIPSNLI